MQKHLRNAVLGAAAVVALGAAPAPAYATIDSKHCLEPPYTESAPYCACVAVATVGMTVDPDSQWACAKP